MLFPTSLSLADTLLVMITHGADFRLIHRTQPVLQYQRQPHLTQMILGLLRRPLRFWTRLGKILLTVCQLSPL